MWVNKFWLDEIIIIDVQNIKQDGTQMLNNNKLEGRWCVLKTVQVFYIVQEKGICEF